MRSVALCTLMAVTIGSTQLEAAKPKAPSAAQLQAQLKKVSQERDDLKERLAATESIQEDLAAAKKSRELARQEAEAAKKALGELRASLTENQSSGDAMLHDLQKSKADLASAQAELANLKQQQEENQAKLKGQTGEGALVILGREITPARAMNISRVTPKVRKVDRGVVVGNVLVGENGEVLDSRLLQGLPGDNEWVQKANEECVEAAKRLVFDPARAADGKTKVRVWQGMGFLID
jgi:hypothetical protein